MTTSIHLWLINTSSNPRQRPMASLVAMASLALLASLSLLASLRHWLYWGHWGRWGRWGRWGHWGHWGLWGHWGHWRHWVNGVTGVIGVTGILEWFRSLWFSERILTYGFRYNWFGIWRSTKKNDPHNVSADCVWEQRFNYFIYYIYVGPMDKCGIKYRCVLYDLYILIISHIRRLWACQK